MDRYPRDDKCRSFDSNAQRITGDKCIITEQELNIRGRERLLTAQHSTAAEWYTRLSLVLVAVLVVVVVGGWPTFSLSVRRSLYPTPYTLASFAPSLPRCAGRDFDKRGGARGTYREKGRLPAASQYRSVRVFARRM